jgi:hypothetical protein
MTIIRTKSLLAASAAAMLAVGSANAAVQNFTVTFEPLNDSGVSGTATLSYDDEAETLTVSVNAFGLDVGPHPMHIHGLFENGVDGDPADSVVPLPSADTDGDGFIEVAEGLPAYGPIILPLVTDPGDAMSFVTVGEDGILDYEQTFDLSNMAIFAPVPDSDETYDAEDLFPLVFRELVIHGLVVPAGAGAGTMFEVDGVCEGDFDFPREGGGCYLARLPIAAGTIEAVDVIPLPGAFAFFLTAGAAGGAFRFRRGRAA